MRLGLDAAELGSTRESGIQPVKHEEAGVALLAEASSRRSSATNLVKRLASILVEKAGVEFIPEDDLKGPGVRLKESTRSKGGANASHRASVSVSVEMLFAKRRTRALARLAKRDGDAANTVSRFENGSGAMVETLVRMQTALESAGVVFIPADHTGGPGVRCLSGNFRLYLRKCGGKLWQAHS